MFFFLNCDCDLSLYLNSVFVVFDVFYISDFILLFVNMFFVYF
jgi:hypothetical protein